MTSELLENESLSGVSCELCPFLEDIISHYDHWSGEPAPKVTPSKCRWHLNKSNLAIHPQSILGRIFNYEGKMYVEINCTILNEIQPIAEKEKLLDQFYKVLIISL